MSKATKTKPPLKQGSPNDFQTPPQALEPLLPYLKKDWAIWECSEGKGNLSESLFRGGYKVVGSDILPGPYPAINSLDASTDKTYTRFWQKDFLSWQPEAYDCIITNPPFSLKQQFLERAYQLQIPFAFLLPLTTFESSKRQRLFKQYGLEVIFFDKRINFETPDGKGQGSWFATAWFTNGLNIGRQLSFYNLKSKQLEFFQDAGGV